MNNILEYQRIMSKHTKPKIPTTQLPIQIPIHIPIQIPIQIPTQTTRKKPILSRQISSNEPINNILEDLNPNNHEICTMGYGTGIQNDYIKTEIIDNLFHKLHRLEQIDANGCIMIKPPKLRRTYNIIDTINNTQISAITLEEKIAIFEEKITALEKSLNDVEILSLYENRLNNLEEFIMCKNKKYLFNEN